MNNPLRQSQFYQLFLAHLFETVREPGVLFWGIIFPILMSLGLGIAFTQKTDTQRTVAIVGNDSANATPPHSSLIMLFLEKYGVKSAPDNSEKFNYKITITDEKLGNFTFLFLQTGWQKAMVSLKQGKLNLILKENNGKPEYHFDPLNPDAQLCYLKLSRLLEHHEQMISGNNENIKPLTLKGTRYIDFLIPGLISMGVMMSSMWGISYSIIEKRSKKLIRRMVATPMKKSGFLAALITVRTGMNVIESLLLFVFANIVFHITIQGSVIALLTIFIAGNISLAGLAVLISCHTSKTEIGNGLINVVVMPMMVLSGIFFSYHNFPEWSIPFIQKLPLTMLADGIRSIFIEGAGLSGITIPSLILASAGILLFTAGLKFFKWH